MLLIQVQRIIDSRVGQLIVSNNFDADLYTLNVKLPTVAFAIITTQVSVV